MTVEPDRGEARAVLRRDYAAARSALSPEVRAAWSQQICAHIEASEWWRSARTVTLVVPVRGEVDLWPLVARGLASGRSILIPRMTDETNKVMVFDRLHTDDRADLVPGPFRIPQTPEPDPVYSPDIDLMLVPATAIDLVGQRLGGGAGYYDRWLAAARSVPNGLNVPRTLATVYAAQVLPAGSLIPAEDHDEPIEAIVTEHGILSTGASYDCRHG